MFVTWRATMTDERALARVRELEEVIRELANVRNAVNGFSISSLKDAGGALWAGEKRDRFVESFEAAEASHSKISEQIGQAIDDCKNKQRTLAFSINPLEHPILSAQALTIALN